jgi:hypothetical protein
MALWGAAKLPRNGLRFLKAWRIYVALISLSDNSVNGGGSSDASLTKVVVVTCALAFLLPASIPESTESVVYAYPSCYCEGTASGYRYNGPTFVGSSSGSTQTNNAPNNVYCASTYCQTWIWSKGKNVCNTYSLNGTGAGAGYVLLDWYWAYAPDQTGHLFQQYDCDDL